MGTSHLTLRQLKTHYFAVFGVFGCISPYLAVYLRDEKGLSPSQMGVIFAVGQTGVLFLPVLMTYLADRYRLVASLLGALFSINLLATGGLSLATGFWACLICIFFNQLANQPQMALSDGLFFSLQSDPTQPRAAYSRVRVWGTVGFIFPSIVIFSVYQWGGLHWVPFAAMGCATIGLINAVRMPHRRPGPPAKYSRLPTLEAARLLAQPSNALFCLGIGCLVASNAAYYGFYPLYLTQQLGIPPRWIGLIANLGVILEVGYILAFERLRARLSLEGLIAAGAAAVVLRMMILAYFPYAVFAIGLQATHGLTVVGVLIAPLMYLNNHVVSDGYRSSVQGLYAMLVIGIFSMSGNYLGGRIAETGLITLYRAGFACAATGFVLICVSLRWSRSRTAMVAHA